MLEKRYTIVMIDDEHEWLSEVERLLKQQGYSFRGYTDPEEGLRSLQQSSEDILAILLDVMFDGESKGLQLLPKVLQLQNAPVVMLSSYEQAVLVERAIKQGAETYVPKNQLETLPERLASFARQRQQVLQKPLEYLRSLGILTQSQKMAEIARKVQRIAPTRLSVLLLGETGTGKTLLAKAIHNESPRRDKPFVVVDVPNVARSQELFPSRLFGTVPGAFTGAPPKPTEGFFHEADGGTLFLDEIGELSLEQQSDLLKPIEERRFYRVGSTKPEEVNIRFIAATNRDLARLVDEGLFRRDLYERLRQESIYLPPLRERLEDIPLLARHFADELPKEIWDRPPATTFEFSTASVEALQSYDWLGNIRELRNVVQRCLLIAHEEGTDSITPRIVWKGIEEAKQTRRQSGNSDYSTTTTTARQAREQAEKEQIERALRKHRGNVTKAAQELGWTREHLYRKLKYYGIDPDRFRASDA
ncbi:MAG: sigma-54 dependent transcriptional regulator [Chlorobiota bacterium]